MIDKEDVREIVEDKLRDKNGSFDFISSDYLDLLIEIFVDSIKEACDECKMKEGK